MRNQVRKSKYIGSPLGRIVRSGAGKNKFSLGACPSAGKSTHSDEKAVLEVREVHRTRIAVLVTLALLAAGCGSRVGEEQVRAEARADALAAGLRAGSGSAGTDAEVAGAEFGAASAEGGGTAAEGGAAGSAGSGSSGGGSGGAAPGAPPGGNGGATDVGVTANEISLGWVGTLTGPVPGLFRGALVGAQSYAAYQNSKGGIFGRKLKVVAADDSLDSGKNRSGHLQLKDKVFAFVGSFSVTDDGGVSVLADCKCPDIGGSLSLSRFNLPNHYNPQPIPPGWRSAGLQYFKQKFPKDVIEHAALFVANVESAKAIARNARSVMEDLGYKIVYTREVGPNETNFTGDVVQMRNQGVKMVNFQGDVGNQARLAAAMRQQGFSVPLANWGNTIYDQNAFRIAGKEALEGALIDQTYSLFQGEDAGRIPEVALFNQWMKRTDPKQTVDLFAMYGWVSMKLFIDAHTKGGAQLTRPKILAELGKIGTWDADGMIGPVNIGQKGPTDCVMIVRIKDGKFVREHPLDKTYDCGLGPFIRK
jgi:ABC-type branched-subunit amino acid transport system substrate-binding protein